MSNPVQDQFDRLPENVQWTLERADGFIDLKMYARAHQTLATIPATHRTVLPVRLHQLRLAMEEQAWLEARGLALGLREELPDLPFLWIQLAYATRRSGTIEEARTILVEAMTAFPQDALIPYNLSCYGCRQGELAEARKHLRHAIHLDSSFRALAMEDEDLEPLWEDVEGL